MLKTYTMTCHFIYAAVSDGIQPVRTGSQEPVLRISLISRTGCYRYLKLGVLNFPPMNTFYL